MYHHAHAHESELDLQLGRTDAYGRFLQGAQPVIVRIGNTYQSLYERTSRFGYNGNGIPITGNKARKMVTLWSVWNGTLGNGMPAGFGIWDSQPLGLGGWTLDVQHAFDIGAKSLRFGDGTSLTPAFLPGTITTVAGTGHSNSSGENVSAITANVQPNSGVTVGPDGSLYITDNHCIRKVTHRWDYSYLRGSVPQRRLFRRRAHAGHFSEAQQPRLHRPGS